MAHRYGLDGTLTGVQGCQSEAADCGNSEIAEGLFFNCAYTYFPYHSVTLNLF